MLNPATLYRRSSNAVPNTVTVRLPEALAQRLAAFCLAHPGANKSAIVCEGVKQVLDAVEAQERPDHDQTRAQAGTTHGV